VLVLLGVLVPARRHATARTTPRPSGRNTALHSQALTFNWATLSTTMPSSTSSVYFMSLPMLLLHLVVLCALQRARFSCALQCPRCPPGAVTANANTLNCSDCYKDLQYPSATHPGRKCPWCCHHRPPTGRGGLTELGPAVLCSSLAKALRPLTFSASTLFCSTICCSAPRFIPCAPSITALPLRWCSGYRPRMGTPALSAWRYPDVLKALLEASLLHLLSRDFTAILIIRWSARLERASAVATGCCVHSASLFFKFTWFQCAFSTTSHS